MAEDTRDLARIDAECAAMSTSREVRLPEDLCAAAEAKFGGAFSSLDELVIFLLREMVQGDTAEIDEAERQAVEQRLRDLGYI